MLALLAHLRGQRSAAAKGYVPVRLRPMQGRFVHETAMAQLEELKREREALEGSYADFNARLEKSCPACRTSRRRRHAHQARRRDHA
jgi:hypothetical protein